jgi:dihydroorotase
MALVIKGGTVIDPSQALHGLLDVKIDNALVTQVAPNIDPAGAQVIDATGKLVTPGLVDLMVHPWPQRNILGLDPNMIARDDGPTTMVSPGDPGPGMVRAFRKQVIESAKPRAFTNVMASYIGYSLWPSPNLPGFNAAYLPDAQDWAGALIENADIAIGAKVLMSESIIGALDLLPLQRALAAVAIAEAATGKTFRVCVHTGAQRYPAMLAQIVDLLRAGDVIHHQFDGNPNSSGQATGFAQGFAVIEAAYTAKGKSIILDVGFGGRAAGFPPTGGSMDYLTAVICMAPLGHAPPGIRPDTLSSDAFAGPTGPAGRMKLPEVMSNLLALNVPSNVYTADLPAPFRFTGVPNLSPAITLDDVVRWATVNPAQVINRVPLLGTLQAGAPGDASVLTLETGNFSYQDGFGRALVGSQRIRSSVTIVGGATIP